MVNGYNPSVLEDEHVPEQKEVSVVYCSNCGCEVTENPYCGGCGYKLSEVLQPVASSQSPDIVDWPSVRRFVEKEVRSVVPASVGIQKEPLRAMPLLCILLCCCFLLPFVSVSCAGEKVSVKGVSLALGFNVEGEDLAVVASAFVALLLAVVALICSFSAVRNRQLGGVVVLCAVGCLVALCAMPSELNRQMGGGGLSINYELGYSLAIGLCVAVVAVGVWAFWLAGSFKLPDPPSRE